MSLSAFFDVCGYDVKGPGSFDFLINQKTVQEIEKEYPRVKFADEGAEVLKREFVEKPDCLLGHLPGGMDEFLKSVPAEPLVPVDK
ncbi:hypothetical protein C8J57DRAFT_1509295 [Mycena rebaudengoi]|nr:hypothetical protein C8J57DRAFT_1509295 [Mycena rebaudengoi]